MKIKFHGKLGESHSWCYTTHDIIRAINKIGGHQIFLKSTDNLQYFPNDLRKFLLPGYHGHLAKGPADYIKENGEQVLVNPKNPLPEYKEPEIPYNRSTF